MDHHQAACANAAVMIKNQELQRALDVPRCSGCLALREAKTVCALLSLALTATQSKRGRPTVTLVDFCCSISTSGHPVTALNSSSQFDFSSSHFSDY
jgi:hypothetical protein